MNERIPSSTAAGQPSRPGLRQRLSALLDREVVPVRHKRGAALVVVLLTVAVLTTVVVDFVYSTRVQLHMAANQRDEVRAYFLARSGMDLARLALGFQKQIDTLTGGRMNIQIWQYLDQFMGAFNAARSTCPWQGSICPRCRGSEASKDRSRSASSPRTARSTSARWRTAPPTIAPGSRRSPG